MGAGIKAPSPLFAPQGWVEDSALFSGSTSSKAHPKGGGKRGRVSLLALTGGTGPGWAHIAALPMRASAPHTAFHYLPIPGPGLLGLLSTERSSSQTVEDTTESCPVTQTGVRQCNPSSLQPPTPGFKRSSCLSLPSTMLGANSPRMSEAQAWTRGAVSPQNSHWRLGLVNSMQLQLGKCFAGSSKGLWQRLAASVWGVSSLKSDLLLSHMSNAG
ncbi:hypothetical protein AAY473_004368 [Plecturocebus cupreus]